METERYYTYGMIMSPPNRVRRHIVFPIRPSVCLSIWLSVTKSHERNSSYSFSQIFLKLCRCFCQGLKLNMTVSCNPQIIFSHFFCSSDLVIFGLKAYRHWVSCERNSFYSLTSSKIFLKLCRCFVKVWRCAWHFAVILILIFVTFLHLGLSHFGA